MFSCFWSGRVGHRECCGNSSGIDAADYPAWFGDCHRISQGNKYRRRFSDPGGLSILFPKKRHVGIDRYVFYRSIDFSWKDNVNPEDKRRIGGGKNAVDEIHFLFPEPASSQRIGYHHAGEMRVGQGPGPGVGKFLCTTMRNDRVFPILYRRPQERAAIVRRGSKQG
jgi:hypothetical protein